MAIKRSQRSGGLDSSGPGVIGLRKTSSLRPPIGRGTACRAVSGRWLTHISHMWTQIELSNVSYIIFKVDLCPFIQKRLDRSGMPVLRVEVKGGPTILQPRGIRALI